MFKVVLCVAVALLLKVPGLSAHALEAATFLAGESAARVAAAPCPTKTARSARSAVRGAKPKEATS